MNLTTSSGMHSVATIGNGNRARLYDLVNDVFSCRHFF